MSTHTVQFRRVGPLRHAALVVLGVLAWLVGGCSEPTVTSPFSGAPVTAGQLSAEQRAWEVEQESAAAREESAAAEELRSLRARAEIDAQRLALSQESQALELRATVDERVQDVLARISASRAERSASAAAVRERVGAALEEIERQREERLAWLGGAQEAIGLAGPAVPGLAPVLGIGGLLLGAGAQQLSKGRLRRELAAEKSGHAETVRAAGAVVDSIDVLKTLSPEAAAAFSKFREQLHEWQGHAGVRLVKRLQDADLAGNAVGGAA